MLPFKLVYSDAYFLPIGKHVFPAEKYRRIRDRLISTGVADTTDFLEPQPATDHRTFVGVRRSTGPNVGRDPTMTTTTTGLAPFARSHDMVLATRKRDGSWVPNVWAA
jgi:hypothetical protein